MDDAFVYRLPSETNGHAKEDGNGGHMKKERNEGLSLDGLHVSLIVNHHRRIRVVRRHGEPLVF